MGPRCSAAYSGSQTTHVPYTVYNTGGDSNTSEMWVRYVD